MPETDEKTQGTHEVEVKEDVLPGSLVRVIEEDKDGEKKKSLEIVLIESGWSKNGFYYSKEVAESVAEFAKERKKMYIDHSDPWSGGPSRSLKDWAATIVESWADGGKAVAKAEMTSNPEVQWLYEEAQKDPENVGASIDAMVKVKPYEPEEGEELTAEEKMNRRYVVEEIRFLNSVDFVTYASAGGVVSKVLASLAGTPQNFQNQFLRVFQQLNVQLEHLNKNTNHTDRKESDMADDKKEKKPTLTLESLQSDYPDVYTSLEQKISKAVKEEYKTATETEQEIKELKDKIGTLESQVNDLETERDSLRTKVDEFETKEAASKKRKKISGFIKEAELTEDYVSDIFIGDLMKLEKDEDIKARIEERVNLIKSADAGVTGNGQRPTQESEETEVIDDDTLVASIKG